MEVKRVAKQKAQVWLEWTYHSRPQEAGARCHSIWILRVEQGLRHCGCRRWGMVRVTDNDEEQKKIKSVQCSVEFTKNEFVISLELQRRL